MNPITIDSIYIGQPQTIPHEEGDWSSSIYRTLVEGLVELGPRSLAGDKVADTKHHGRPGQAVCCHPMVYYHEWNQEYDIAGTEKEIGPGSVGENWTLLNAFEDEICIGDIYTVGSARVEVSGPRYPCFKQERKVELQNFLARIKESLRTGFYLSVLTPGTVQAGDTLVLESRPCSEITLRLFNETIFKTKNPDMIQRLLDTPELNDDWKSHLQKLPTH